MDDPCDEWPCLQDMSGIWHVKTEAHPGISLGEITSGLLMQAVREYFEATNYA